MKTSDNAHQGRTGTANVKIGAEEYALAKQFASACRPKSMKTG